jgi:hypothetical protein
LYVIRLERSPLLAFSTFTLSMSTMGESLRYPSLRAFLKIRLSSVSTFRTDLREQHLEAHQTEFFAVDPRRVPASSRQQHLKARLLFLEKLELAQSNGSNRWLVRSDFQTILEAMQNAADRQRSLAQHGALLSDTRLPIRLTDAKQLQQPLEGRVLGHVEDERTGRAYMILEGTDQNVHFIWHTIEIESARRQRKLASNSFIRITPRSANGRTLLLIADFGSSEQLLNNTDDMRNRPKA